MAGIYPEFPFCIADGSSTQYATSFWNDFVMGVPSGRRPKVIREVLVIFDVLLTRQASAHRLPAGPYFSFLQQRAGK